MRDPLELDEHALKAGDLPKALRSGPSTCLTRFPAPYRWATRGEFAQRDWRHLMEAATRPELWPGAGTTASASHGLPAWTFARYRDDTRVVTRDEALSARETRARVVEVCGLMVDYVDEPAVDAVHLDRWWGAHAFLAYTTGFHELPMDDRPAGPRWRVMVPFSHPVDLPTAIAVGAWARHPRHDAGIVAPVTEEAWRVVPVPAVGPGGYRWLARAGERLDPDQALKDLATWRVLDTRVRAEAALEGTSFGDAVGRFLVRRQTPRLRPRFPLPPIEPLRERLDALWPGRVVAVMGTSGSGKTSLALQIAAASATAGLPVLVVLTRMGGDEVVARLLAQRSGVRPSALLAGHGDGVDAAAEELRASCPSLHLWAPTADQRDLAHLRDKVSAVSDAHDGAPPLVVVDGVEGWGVDDPERGARQLVSGLRDASHTGTLSPTWPGAAVVVVGDLPHARLGPDALLAQWERGTLDLGALQHEASAVVAVATEGSHGLALVAKNRDGEMGPAPLSYDPAAGRFGDPPG